MGVVLSEAAHTEKAMQSSGELMTMYKTQFSHSEWQIAIGTHLCLIYKHSARAVHGLNGKIGLVDHGGIHIVLIVIPMTGTLPKVPIEHYGSGYLDIAVTLVNLAPILD